MPRKKGISTRDKFDILRPTTPSIYFIYSNHATETDAEVYALRCKAMEISIECFAQTASVNITGKWKNKTNEEINCVFMIPMRGTVTDCFINIGTERVYSVGLAEKKEAKSVVYNQEMVYDFTQYPHIYTVYIHLCALL